MTPLLFCAPTSHCHPETSRMLQASPKPATHSSRWRWRRTTLEISSPSGALASAWRCLASSPLEGKSTWQGGLCCILSDFMLPCNDKDDLRWHEDAWAGLGHGEWRWKYPRCSSYGSLPLELSVGWEDSQLYGSALKHFLNGMWILLKIDLSARLSVLHGTNLDLASYQYASIYIKLARNLHNQSRLKYIYFAL